MGSDGKVTKALLVDLDGTLYRSSQLFADVRVNINDYVTNVLGVPREEADELSGRLYREYGLTILGLMNENFNVDRDHWHKTVHGNLDYEKLLPKNPALRELLDSLKMPKYIFTNADTVHANVCLEHIGIKDCFDGIISFDCMHDWAKRQGGDASKKAFAKPERKAFEFALERAGCAEAATTMFLDDSAANIKGAKEVGLQTVFVGNSQPCEGADHAIENFLQLKDTAPYLWS